jgi:hypothetical protein
MFTDVSEERATSASVVDRLFEGLPIFHLSSYSGFFSVLLSSLYIPTTFVTPG